MRALDLFAGLGGFTAGAKMAGVSVVWAANHWPLAVEYHTANNPHVVHSCQDLRQADWRKAPHADLLLASPCCQGHTRARGKEQPHHDDSRSTAWAVVDALECTRCAVAIVENVPEFRRWKLYPVWVAALHALGYSVASHILDAADAGVPQNRQRLFIVATKSRNPVALKFPKAEHQSARQVIHWDRFPWTRIDRPGRAAATLARVARGRTEHGDRFVMPYYGGGSGLTGRSIDRPLGTLTTRARWAVVDGNQMRMLHPSEALAAMSFPADYRIPKSPRLANHLIGNAVCPLQAKTLIQAVREAV